MLKIMYSGEASQVLTPCVCAGAPCHWCWVVTSGDLLTFITLVTRLTLSWSPDLIRAKPVNMGGAGDWGAIYILSLYLKYSPGFEIYSNC